MKRVLGNQQILLSHMPTDESQPLCKQVVLVTGAAARIGATLARSLHGVGADVVVHYHRSAAAAEALVAELNAKRGDSAIALSGDVREADICKRLVDEATSWHDRLDILINNASSFYPTPLGTGTAEQWHDLIGSNLLGPFFLSQAAAPHLKRSPNGNIVNLIDIYADKALADYPIYCAAKAGLASLTRSLALALAPDVRVNGIAPGSILWAVPEPSDAQKQHSLAQIPLGQLGGTQPIAEAAHYLLVNASYVTGQIMAIDGGRSIN